MITSAFGATDSLSLAGPWRLQLYRENADVEERWFTRQLSDWIELPTSLRAAGIGDPVSVDTPWVGNIFDPSWYMEFEYDFYRQPGNIKVPFWLQPETYDAGAA